MNFVRMSAIQNPFLVRLRTSGERSKTIWANLGGAKCSIIVLIEIVYIYVFSFWIEFVMHFTRKRNMSSA